MSKHEPYYSIIHRHLVARTPNNVLSKDSETGLPLCTSAMLKDCLHEVQKTNPNVTIQDLARLDNYCCGHIDYHSKLSLRLHEISKRN